MITELHCRFTAGRRAGVIVVLLLCLACPAILYAQCSISPSKAAVSPVWDDIFTQDGPGKGIEPSGAPGWTGGDSTYSLLLPGGRTAFFFSDSYIGEWPAAKGDGTVTRSAAGLRTTALNCFPPTCEPQASSFNARNSITILDQNRKRMTTLAGPKDENGLSTSYFKEPAAGLYYWMGDAALLPAGASKKQRVIVFLHKFDAKLAFHGASVAELDPETLAIKKQTDVRGLPGLDIHWGTAMVRENDTLYIYGKGARNGKKQAFLARTTASAALDELTDSSKWSVWNGHKWTAGLADAAPVTPAADSVSDEFSVVRFKINGRPTYLLAGIDTSVPFGSWRDITLYSSCTPEGPFTGKHVVYAMPESGSFTVPGLPAGERLKEHLVVYNPHIHPQFSGNGKILISYNINRSHNSDSVYIDGYRPRFIEVPVAGLK